MNLQTSFKTAVSALSFETRADIDGQFVDAASGKTFPTINPASGEVITNVASRDAEDELRCQGGAGAEGDKDRDLLTAENNHGALGTPAIKSIQNQGTNLRHHYGEKP